MNSVTKMGRPACHVELSLPALGKEYSWGLRSCGPVGNGKKLLSVRVLEKEIRGLIGQVRWLVLFL